MRLGGGPRPVFAVLAAFAVSVVPSACRQSRGGSRAETSQVMTGMTMVESLGGKRVWQLEAATARLGEAAEFVHADEPLIRIQKNGAEVTRMTAQRGRFHVNRRDLELEGNVVATQLQEGSTLYTQALHFDAESDRVWTDLPVRIERPEGTVRGKGLRAKSDLSEIVIQKQEGRIR